MSIMTKFGVYASQIVSSLVGLWDGTHYPGIWTSGSTLVVDAADTTFLSAVVDISEVARGDFIRVTTDGTGNRNRWIQSKLTYDEVLALVSYSSLLESVSWADEDDGPTSYDIVKSDLSDSLIFYVSDDDNEAVLSVEVIELADLWDGTYLTGVWVQSTGPILNADDAQTTIRSIAINVSDIASGEQIKVTCSSQPNRYRFGAGEFYASDLISFQGQKTLLDFEQAASDLSAPHEYIYTIPVDTNTVMFYISSISEEVVTSVEVI